LNNPKESKHRLINLNLNLLSKKSGRKGKKPADGNTTILEEKKKLFPGKGR
jgi:hypothetical protein